ncbi:MAG TPA: rod shape-determining protein MreC [Gammaproteobacteria bacterium]
MFFSHPSALARLVVVGIVSVALMTTDHRGRHLDTVRGVLATVVYPLQYAVDLPIKAGTWLAETVTAHSELLEQNERLRFESLRIQSKLEKFAELEAENRRLRKLLNSSTKVSERVLIAELLSVDMDPFSRKIVLNKGTRDGVFSGQSLIDSNGIMGQVVHAGPFSSNALLITDPSHALPVQAHRTGLRAVAVGTGSLNLLELLHIPNNADIRVGDLLVTSGLGGRFPPGYPVGYVVSVERDRGRPFTTVRVEPTARLERNREVLLVWPASRGDMVDSAYRPEFGG